MILSVVSWFPFVGAYLRSFSGHFFIWGLPSCLKEYEGTVQYTLGYLQIWCITLIAFWQTPITLIVCRGWIRPPNNSYCNFMLFSQFCKYSKFKIFPAIALKPPQRK